MDKTATPPDEVLNVAADAVAGFFMNSDEAMYPRGGFTIWTERAALIDLTEVLITGLARDEVAMTWLQKAVDELKDHE